MSVLVLAQIQDHFKVLSLNAILIWNILVDTASNLLTQEGFLQGDVTDREEIHRLVQSESKGEHCQPSVKLNAKWVMPYSKKHCFCMMMPA